MADTANPKHLDKRTAERYLRNGELDEKAYERHIGELPDVAEKSVPVETRMDDDGLDDEEDFDDEEEDGEDDEEDGESAE